MVRSPNPHRNPDRHGSDDGKRFWKLDGVYNKATQSLVIDFSPKGGPKDLLGKYDEFGGVPGIVFPDGMTLIEHACLELLTPPHPLLV